MNSWMKSTGAALLGGLAVYLMKQFEGMLTPGVTKVVVIVLLFGLVGLVLDYGISWTWTQAYKKLFVPDFKSLYPVLEGKTPDQKAELLRQYHDEVGRWRSRIYLHAMISTGVAHVFAGVGLVLLNVPEKLLIVFVVAWALYGAVLAGASPFIWKLLFETLSRYMTGLVVKRNPVTGEIGVKDLNNPGDPTLIVKPRGDTPKGP